MPLFTFISEQVELAVDVLGQLLPFVSAVEVVERFSAELLRGLDHPHEKVRSLVLKQVRDNLYIF